MTYLTDEMLLAFLDGIIADGGSVLAYQARATVKDLLVERAARQQPVATSQRTQPKANFNVGQEIEVMKTLQEEIAALADRHPKHMISIDVDQAGQAFCIFFVDGELPSEAMRVRGLNALDEMIATLKAASIVKTTPSPQREEGESIQLHTKGQGAVDAEHHLQQIEIIAQSTIDGNTTPWKNAMRAIIEEVADVRSAFATPPVQPAHDKGEGK